MASRDGGSVKTEEECEEITFNTDDVVESSRGSYVVMSLIGKGGFGAVYKVHDSIKTSKVYALKVEVKRRAVESKLKMEVAILKEVSRERADRSHFTALIDRGKKANFCFLVMQLVGRSLSDLKSRQPNKIFSINSGLGAAVQCLEALEDLHKNGYVHRDIKPSNFAVGLEEKIRTVYVLDFGISRKIINEKKEIKAPRAVVGFKGTVKFASVAAHRHKEIGYKDDCESWVYLTVDLTVQSGLPWKGISNRDDVRRRKEESRRNKSRLFQGLQCKKQLMEILDYIDGLRYSDVVDYGFVYKLLKNCAKACAVSLDEPFDWETDSADSDANPTDAKSTHSELASSVTGKSTGTSTGKSRGRTASATTSSKSSKSSKKLLVRSPLHHQRNPRRTSSSAQQ